MRLQNFASGLAAVALGAAGCHPRANPSAGAASYDLAHDAIEGSFGKTLEATLGEGDRSAQAFRFEVKAKGTLLATAKALDTQAAIDVVIYPQAPGSNAIAKGAAGKNLEAKIASPGTYYVAVEEPSKDAVRTRVSLRVVYKPQDPDAQAACKTEATARDLPLDAPKVEDSVDYSQARRTCYWHLALDGDGTIAIRFDNQGNKISADFVPARGAAEKIDPARGLTKDLPAGDYYVKVYANDAGDGGQYALSTSFAEADTCKDGGPACSIEGAEELKLPADTKTGEVDYAKSKQFHFYKLSPKEKGRLTIGFKIVQPPRGSKVQAFFMRGPADDGERLTATPTTKDVEQPGDYFVRVQAPDAGDAAKYTVSVLWSPANFIPGDVVEIGRSPCLLTVSAGSNQGVRSGGACTVVSASGQPIDSCVVDQTFPNLSKVRPGNARCNVQSNATVQISAQ
jgi:hypothetical protein